MSSRWDALKPTSSDRKNGIGARQELYPRSGKNKDDNGGSGRRRRRVELEKKKNSETVDEINRNWRQKPSAACHRNEARNSKDNAIATRNQHLAEWNALTKDLWKCSHMSGRKLDQSSNDQEASKNVNEIWPILNKLSDILGDTGKGGSRRDAIHPTQLGVALDAASNLLNALDDQKDIIAVLEWCCSLFRCSASKDGIQLGTDQAQKCVQNLLRIKSTTISEKRNNSKNKVYYKCLTETIISFAGLLPAEETAHQVVGAILLPTLEDNLNRFKILSKDTLDGEDTEILLLSFKMLQSLLREKKHASAILAPLVNDVAVDGQELCLSNPLRSRLFLVLQLGLIVLPGTSLLAENLFQCLTLAIQMADLIDKSTASIQEANRGGNKAHQSSDLDIAAVERLLQESFLDYTVSLSNPNIEKSSRYRVNVLELLLSFLKSRPEASLYLGKTLLLQEPRRSATSNPLNAKKECTKCNYSLFYEKYSPFLCCLHDRKDSKERTLMMECLIVLVHAIPWKLWMGKVQVRGSTSNYSQRVADAILGIVDITNCMLVSKLSHPIGSTFHNRPSVVDPLPRLLKVILLEVPYYKAGCQGVDDRINKTAQNLFEIMASGKLLLNERQPNDFRESIVEVFGECMGGRETPEGSITTMIAPTQSWFSSSSSRNFRDDLFKHIKEATRDSVQRESGVPSSLVKTSAKLLCFMLQARPHKVINNIPQWEMFKDSIGRLCEKNNKNLQLTGLQLLGSFLLGRQEHISCMEVPYEKVVSYVLSILPKMTSSAHGPCQIACFEAYGALNRSDWLSSDLSHHLQVILPRCVEEKGESVANVRGAACKTIGDIYSNCFFESNSNDIQLCLSEGSLRNLSLDICRVLVQATKDSNASVRSMVRPVGQRLALEYNHAIDFKLFSLRTGTLCSRKFGPSNGLLADRFFARPLHPPGHMPRS